MAVNLKEALKKVPKETKPKVVKKEAVPATAPATETKHRGRPKGSKNLGGTKRSRKDKNGFDAYLTSDVLKSYFELPLIQQNALRDLMVKDNDIILGRITPFIRNRFTVLSEGTPVTPVDMEGNVTDG